MISASRLVRLTEIVLIAASYVATAKLGFLMAIPPGNVTAVWPPAGIALAALLLRGNGVWPGILLGSFCVNSWFFVDLTTFSAGGIATAFSIGVGSTLQALIGTFLIRHFVSIRVYNLFDRPQNVFKFALIEMLSCLIAAIFGVTSLCLGGFLQWTAYPYTWWTWWLGDLSGVITTTPLLLIWSQPTKVRWKSRRFVEALIVIGLMFAVGQSAFGKQFNLSAAQNPMKFILFPFVIWGAFRFGQRGVTAIILIISAIMILGILIGLSPFIDDKPDRSLLLMQIFIGTITITGLAMAAAISERQAVGEALQKAHDNLERRVEERTADLFEINAKLEREIAERQRAEEASRYLATVVEFANDAIIGKTLEGVIADEFRWILDRIRQGENIDYYETDRLCKDGRRIKNSFTASPIKDAAGRVTGISTVATDLTRRKKLDYERLELIFDAAPSGMIVVGPQSKIWLVNVEIEKMFGYSREELLNRSIEMLFPERFRSQHIGYGDVYSAEPTAHLMGAGRELYGLRKDRREFPIEVGSSPITISEGAISSTVVIYSVVDTSDRKSAEEQIKASLREKEALLREVHHRVKNNLQVISSLFNLQAKYIQNKQTRTIFAEIQNRIRSMALIHEKLHQSEDLGKIEFAGYIFDLTTTLFRSYGVKSNQIRLNVNVDKVLLGLDSAIPCGLIVNELVSNAIKHAFPLREEAGEKSGEIGIKLYPKGDKFILIVSDNGVGFPKEVDFRNSETLGLRLVNVLVNQLDGSIELSSDGGEGGTEFTVAFAEIKYKERPQF